MQELTNLELVLLDTLLETELKRVHEALENTKEEGETEKRWNFYRWRDLCDSLLWKVTEETLKRLKVKSLDEDFLNKNAPVYSEAGTLIPDEDEVLLERLEPEPENPKLYE
jgi:predicted transcriptional regulator